MSTSEPNEFAALIEAHAGRSLTGAEEQRLRALAASHPDRAAELAAIDGVHGLLDGECALREAVAAPTTAAEEADEGFRRLAAAAATAEAELRAELLHRGAPAHRRIVVRRLRRWPLLAAAAAVAFVALALWLGNRAPDRPGLLDGRPDDATLGGGARIVLRAELSVRRPELSWHPVVAASRYDAVVEDADGGIVLQRAPERTGSTSWELTRDEVLMLVERRDAGVELLLRIVARDRAGLPVASSGDLPLRLVD